MARAVFRTTLGWGGVVVSGKGICKVILPRRDRRAVGRELTDADRGPNKPARMALPNRILRRSITLLQRYFSGKPVRFDLPLDLRHHTVFQRSVWKAAAAIPYGKTRPYGWIAKRVGRPGAARAVGQAMGANPVPVIIP